MKKKVEELQKLFVARIQAGEFEVVKIKDRYATISIDGYLFCFGNCKGDTRIWQGAFENFMVLPEIVIGSYVIEAIEQGIKQAKIDQLNKLQKEIQEL